ncbi:hypothetical protein NC651_015486 [Populus alba x Populus x berolinensis]|nr:hypothetical protein NC651_015486 [Populus alba x Populus x berolinensis]
MGFHGFFPFGVLLHSLPFLGQAYSHAPHTHTHTVLFFIKKKFIS